MKLRFRQRFFSWFDSYDIYDDAGNTVFTVKGELSWGHCLRVFDINGNEAGLLKEEIFHFLHPTFQIYLRGAYSGCIRKELTLFSPKFSLEFRNWYMDGDWLEWDYTICDAAGRTVAVIGKEPFHLTDTYIIEVPDPSLALDVLMVTLAIDAEKCSRN